MRSDDALRCVLCVRLFAPIPKPRACTYARHARTYNIQNQLPNSIVFARFANMLAMVRIQNVRCTHPRTCYVSVCVCVCGAVASLETFQNTKTHVRCKQTQKTNKCMYYLYIHLCTHINVRICATSSPTVPENLAAAATAARCSNKLSDAAA